MESIEPTLVDLGIAGAFILYLIYDRQILMKRLFNLLDDLKGVIQDLDKDIIKRGINK